MNDLTPLPNGDRNHGRYVKGCRPGPGNPYGKYVNRWRKAFIGATSVEDIRAIVAKLLEMAKAGDLGAIHEVLDRTIGKSVQPVDLNGNLMAALFLRLEVAQNPKQQE